MHILFAVTHVGFLRNFESTLALLAERGHQVHIASDRRRVPDAIDVTPIINRLQTRHPNSFTFDAVGFSKQSPWYKLSIAVRAALNYWRYLAPEFDQAPALRARGREMAPEAMARLTDLPIVGSPTGIGLLRRLFKAVERAIPPRREVERLFDQRPWDLVFITPLLYFGSQQVDYVRAARRRGIPSLLGVGSWDHLTTKGLIHERPDRVVVWNEQQRREAADLHGLDPDTVIVTGAQAYDHWFALQTSTTRETFCGRVGLPAGRPYLLYLCSSPFIAPHEVEFVRGWIRAVRASRLPELRDAGIMVRPHPQNAKQWAGVNLSEFGDAVIWPRAGANPVEMSARHEYYDSMAHSHGVVGINTSALIESGIVGRLVYSVKASEFAGTQEGTLHFQHLKNGGLLRLADDLEEHTAQLERSFVSVERDREQIRGFIQSFVRPAGLDRAATPQVVDAAEATGRLALVPQRLPSFTRALQVTLGLLFRPFDRPRADWRLSRLRPDLQYWWSLWRHTTRPLRLAGRRAFGGARKLARAARRSAASLVIGLRHRLSDRGYWWSTWRHATRPLRLAIRKGASLIHSVRKRLRGRTFGAIVRHATRPARLAGRRLYAVGYSFARRLRARALRPWRRLFQILRGMARRIRQTREERP